ncbi:6,7,8-trihydroxycoumarin synthase-like [Salvia miltiorrhiza]|uniref:6,7,8-trihydroxycoumarin synthase-like n=1 Tax=Salvia miltiorrhiza TaxID=226208 RepID=UPI0025ABBF9F|nr:6,7,8-trihydroxycoumarin synthase-like [Salvia miltiorrhiza]
MNTLIVMMIIILVITVMLIRTTRKKKKNKPLAAGPRGVPLLGNLLQFDKSNTLSYLQKLSHNYGPVALLRHGSTPIRVVSSAALAKQILKTHDNKPSVLGQQKLSYGGADIAFSPHNPHWKEMRRLCALHLFSPAKLASFRPVREAQVARMMATLQARCSAANLSELAMSLASNIICGVAFGRTYDDDEYEKKKLDKLVLEAQALMVSFYFSDHLRVFSWVDKLSGLLGRLDTNFDELDAFYQQLIDEHIHASSSQINSETKQDILHHMIQLKRQKPDSITWDHIKALLMNLFVAGTDTVAAAIVWTMTGLMLRPAIMKKTQEHIRQAIGCKKQGEMIEEDELEKLPYLKAVVMEALRLYPPAPLLYRIEQQSQSIDGYEIEEGTTFIINAWAIARDPENWEDPDEFMPERFIVGSDWELRMLPFGGGRRGCPGMGMGMIATHLALANLLYSFDWALPPSAPAIDTDALPGLTMHKKNPLILLPIVPSCFTSSPIN